MERTEAIDVQVDPALKIKVDSILKTLGLTQSEAISIFYNQVVMHKGLPFEVKIPAVNNDEAIEKLMSQLEEGIKDIDEGRFVTLEELDAMLDYKNA